MTLPDCGLASTGDLFKNATDSSHLPTQKMLRTVELQVLGVLPVSAELKTGLVVSSDSDRDTRWWLHQYITPLA